MGIRPSKRTDVATLDRDAGIQRERDVLSLYDDAGYTANLQLSRVRVSIRNPIPWFEQALRRWRLRQWN